MFSLLSALTSLIVASSMSERTHLTGHLIISCLCSILIFPVSAHWIWHSEGWLAVRGCTDLGPLLKFNILSLSDPNKSFLRRHYYSACVQWLWIFCWESLGRSTSREVGRELQGCVSSWPLAPSDSHGGHVRHHGHGG